MCNIVCGTRSHPAAKSCLHWSVIIGPRREKTCFFFFGGGGGGEGGLRTTNLATSKMSLL